MANILLIESELHKRLTDTQRKAVHRAAGQRFALVDRADLLPEDFSRVEVGFGFLAADDLYKMPNLRWLQLSSAGVDYYMGRNCFLNPAFRITNASGAYGKPISEHLLAMMLSMQRGLHRYRDFQREHAWQVAEIPFDFHASTVLIVGLGDIGLETARKCKALGATVLAVKRTAMDKPDFVDELYFDLEASLDDCLRRANFVALCLPSTGATKHVLSAERIRSLKDDAIVSNIGRGALIDQEALTEELRTGRIMAALDVMTPEPLPKDHPLWDLPNCLITPHMAGRAARSIPAIFDIFIDNLNRYLAGEPLHNAVDFQAGY